jgi:two-component system cell cycle sensor histidine kinase/response regulator CckA
MAPSDVAPDATSVTGVRTRLAPLTRALLDIALAGFLVLLWETDSIMAWLLLAYITVACRAFLRSDGRATVLRATLVTLVGGGIMLRFAAAGEIPRNDALEVPLVALLAYLFAGFAAWRSRIERVIVLDRERLATMIDSIPLATVVFDADDRVVTWNPTAEALFGWSADEVFGRANPIVQPDEQASSDALHKRIRCGETLMGVEVERRSADGTVLELSVFTAPIDTHAELRGGFLVLYEDIRERKRAQRERDDAQSRYRQLVEALPLVTYVDCVDDSATNIFTSPQVVEMLGWKLDDWLANPYFFESLLHPDDAEHAMAGVRAANANHGAYEGEYRMRHRSGAYVWVRDQSTIVESPGGTPFARGFLLDITRQKELEEQLLQAQKMEALGQFAGGIAHDFNNLLTAISGYAELAAGSALADPALMRSLNGITAASTQAASLTSRLLSFSRHDVVERRLVDVNEIARTVAELLERLVREDVVVQLELAEALPAVSADPAQLKQVVLNLALNARDAMADGGTLTIETAALEDSLVLRVRDTGCGMDDVTKSRAFEPFFTTKPEGKGTGLGLAVAYGVVEALGGTLSIHSAPGEGATLEAVLPATSGQATAPADPTPLAAAGARGVEHVLIVEDREVVRNLARDVLHAAGFVVATATGSREALAIVERSAPFDLLVTDVVMPELSGPELAKELRGAFVELPVLYMSGYTDDVLDASSLDEPATAFLRKPFANGDLVSTVRRLLDAPHVAQPSAEPTGVT